KSIARAREEVRLPSSREALYCRADVTQPPGQERIHPSHPGNARLCRSAARTPLATAVEVMRPSMLCSPLGSATRYRPQRGAGVPWSERICDGQCIGFGHRSNIGGERGPVWRQALFRNPEQGGKQATLGVIEIEFFLRERGQHKRV